MGKRTVDDISLTALADTLREQSGEAGQLMFPADFLRAVRSVYDSGHTHGMEDGAELCMGMHFVRNFIGDGGVSHSVHVPFEPDVVCITGFDPTCIKKNYQMAMVMCDIRAFGVLGGLVEYGDAGTSSGIANMAYTTTSMLTRYSRTADGTITLANIGPSGRTVVYGAGVPYTLIAVKYAEQTDKERITAFVKRLTGSGSVTLNKSKVNAAFTDSQWAALIATKPGWTFSWI